jgi:hypothetical protein
MLRVLVLLARRRCSVLRAAFVPAQDSGSVSDLLTVEVDAPNHLRRNVVAWISSLVAVLEVHCV